MHPPFDAYEFCERLAEHRKRRIKVRATDLGATSGVGHLAPTATVDRIFVERDSPVPQQTLVIYHEVMHIVRDHLATGDSVTCGIGPAENPESGAYADWREWEAEAGARELARLAGRRPAPNRLTTRAGAAEHSIAAAFGFTHGR
nr:ImmA/IrrE family metallo-endopeptidase [Kibdelosporangium phytohabitans]